jgi:hypothetical protein
MVLLLIYELLFIKNVIYFLDEREIIGKALPKKYYSFMLTLSYSSEGSPALAVFTPDYL